MMEKLKMDCNKHGKQNTITLMSGTTVCERCYTEFDKDRKKKENTFVYEGIVSEQQGSVLCLKYKGYEAKKLQPFFSFLTKFRQKGTIRLNDDDLKKMVPYSLEGKKVRVYIEILGY